MIVIYGMVLLWYLVVFILSGLKQNRKHERKYALFEGAADYLYGICLKHKIFRQRNVKERLHILHPEMEGKEEREKNHLRRFYVNKIRLLLLVVFIGDVLAIALFVVGRMESAVTDGKYINRNSYGMGSKEIALQAQIESGLGKTENRQDFSVTVEEQKYEDASVKQMAKEASALLPDIIKGENASIEEVRSRLNLVRKIEGYPFQVVWESDNYSLVYSDGSIMNEQAKAEGEIVNLTAVLTYGSYKEEHIFPVCIFPPEYSEEELWRKKINEMLVSWEEEDRSKDRMELPETIEGEKLIWSEKKEDSSGYLFLFLCLCAGGVYFLQEEKLKEKIEERNHQMLLDYPQFISKLMLYMGAGMTVRNAFQRIASQYHREKQEEGYFRYVYEEMLLICHELDSGISEAVAYEHFGKRCRLPQYTKLVNILVQNLRKGSNGILDALRQEAKNAFEERKNVARKLGEEAGTKLLLPMMLMLGIVMVLIIIPAYFSFSV